MIDDTIRRDFPLIYNSDVAYLDSGATAQKPECVIKAMDEFYKKHNANIHRGAYKLSVEATSLYDEARECVASFIGATRAEEVVFAKNATECANLLAYSYGLNNVTEGDEIVISIMEHHSNLVPWQMVAKAKKATLKYLYIGKDYTIPDTELEKITQKTKIVSITAVSNVLGTIVDTDKIVKRAHMCGAICILDISQSIVHFPFDAKKSGADFAFFSGHKMYAGLGCGVLWGKYELLDSMRPFILGGDMIEYVTEQDTTFSQVPTRFEAGTQDIAAVVSLKSAIEYIKSIGYEKIASIESELICYAMDKLSKIPYLTVYAPKKELHAGVISFNIKNLHAHDVSSWLDMYGVCIRAGHHCAQPLIRYLNIETTCRASLSVYNNFADIDKLAEAIKKTISKFEKYISR